ncbi:rhodanese-like domain-containing protein [Rhodococcus sp. YH1]|uniref:rhodanese-like domain-containing protein n=1 Tax=Rhodococcus sp. YH1 TaxID=89066 RepID=UPI001A0B479C|nr:Thiosulfate sulfurtransferase GlpE [Rhodococcus sp. YH1]
MTDTEHALTEHATAETVLVAPIEALRRVENGALLLDVRRAASRVADGVVPDSEHVEKADVALTFEPLADRNRDIVVFCTTEGGSSPVVEQLFLLGYSNVAHVDGGYRAWKAAGLPTRDGESAGVAG